MSNKIELEKKVLKMSEQIHSLTGERDGIRRTISKLRAKLEYLDDEIEKLHKEALSVIDQLKNET